MAILKKLNVGILAVTTMITALAGLFVFVPIFFDEPDAPVAELKRYPSSIQGYDPVPKTALPGPPKVDTVNLRCLDRSPPSTLTSRAKFLRLVGKICDGVKLEQSAIINRANGFIATIYQLDNRGRMTTDYIQLSPGQNRITYDFNLASGGVSGEILVEYSEERSRQ